MRRLLSGGVLVVAAACAAACGDTTLTTPAQVNFDRPVDISFACYGGLRITDGAPADPAQVVTTSAQPLEACTIRSGPRAPTDPVPVPPGQENLTMEGGAPIPGASWYGFILQSAPGTVAIAEFATNPVSGAAADVGVRDADPLTPGNNGISVGEEPIAIAPDSSGCYQVIANSGSCDMSALDVGSALDNESGVRVTRIAVTNATGELIDARPAAMVAQPSDAVIGASCPATPTGIVYIAYPQCHLVAAVDTATGTIVDGIQFDVNGVATVLGGGAVSCPSECGAGIPGTTPGARPVTLDLHDDPRTGLRRLAIGADNSASLTIAELGPDSRPLSVRQIALENTTGTLGVAQVALAPQIGMGGNMGVINDEIAGGGQFQFVYAIATDDTVRVADILTLDRECDTQVDPRLINDITNVAELSCFPVGAASTPARRPGARGPGIQLFGDALPTAIEIFRSDEIPNDTRSQGPSKLVGYFGVITSASGATYVLNVDDDDYRDVENPSAPLEVSLPLAIAHQLRDAVPIRDLVATTEVEVSPGVFETRPICESNGPDPDGQAGPLAGPRATGAPLRNVPGGVIAAEKVGQLPYIRQVTCVGADSTRAVSELGFAAPPELRDLTYPDLRVVRNESWVLTWEGGLSSDRPDANIDGPPIRVGQLEVDTAAGMDLVDGSAPYCEAGVEPYDIVQLRGCNPALGDAECPLGYSCFVHPENQVAGLGACMLTDEGDRLFDACKDFMTSQRRYTVGRSAAGELRLLPRATVLRTTPVDGCVDDAQCEALADYALELTSAAHPVATTTGEEPRTYACRPDPTRAPLDGPGQTGNRCVETCTETADCTTGRICRSGMCMEGVVPPQSCVNGPQRYELRVGDAFAVIGTQSGYIHSTIVDPVTGQCVRDPAAHPFEIGRIELTPPPCDPTTDPRTGRLPDGSFGPNPCTLTVTHSEAAPSYAAGTCTAANPPTQLVEREAPAIRFRNPALTTTIVDPYYPGDETCIRDREGMFGDIPIVYPGFQLTWRQTGGFIPFTLPISPAFPIKVVRGPLESIWVIDAGDFLPTSLGQSQTRGRVFRVHPQAPGAVTTIE